MIALCSSTTVLLLCAAMCRKARDTIHKNRFLKKVAAVGIGSQNAGGAQCVSATSPNTYSPATIPNITSTTAEEANSSPLHEQCPPEPATGHHNNNNINKNNNNYNSIQGGVQLRNADGGVSAVPAPSSSVAEESFADSSPARPSAPNNSACNSCTPPLSPAARGAAAETEAGDSKRLRCLTFSAMPAAKESGRRLLQPKLSLNGAAFPKGPSSSCSAYELTEVSQCSSTLSLDPRSTAGPVVAPSATGGAGGTTCSETWGGSDGGGGSNGGVASRKPSRAQPLAQVAARFRLRVMNSGTERSETLSSPTPSVRGARSARNDERRRLEQQREAKARRTLLIITLSFCR